MKKGYTNEGNYLYLNLESIKWKEEIYVGSDIVLGLLLACFEFLYIRVKVFRQKFKVQFKECVGKNDRVRVN